MSLASEQPDERPAGDSPETAAGGQRFSRRLRISQQAEFLAVYNAAARRRVGPLLIYARPNGRVESRLGLSVPKRCGNAVQRNRIKRRLREAFRLNRRDWPVGYDVVVNVQQHDIEHRDAYAAYLTRALDHLHDRWLRSENQS